MNSVKLFGVAIALSLAAGSVTAVPIMHVHDSGGNLATVDVATGAVSPIGNMGVTMTDIAFSPTGALFGISFSALFSINPTTAAASFIGNHPISGGNALVFASDGTLYGAGNSSTSLFSINPLTGAGSNLGNMGFSSGGDLAFNGGNFFLASSASQLIDIDLLLLSNSSAVGSFGVGGVFGLATGDNGVLYAVAGTNVYTVNTTTGAATNPINYGGQGLGTAFGQSFFSESGNVVVVPEPGSMILVGLGLVGIGLGRLRKL